MSVRSLVVPGNVVKVYPLALEVKQLNVNVVPSLSVWLSPEIAVVPTALPGQRKEFRVAVQNLEPTGGPVDVALDVPAGWTVSPASTRLTFSVEHQAM